MFIEPWCPNRRTLAHTKARAGGQLGEASSATGTLESRGDVEERRREVLRRAPAAQLLYDAVGLLRRRNESLASRLR